jgi:deoxycytidylate deaminase
MTTAFVFAQRSVDPVTKHGCVFVDNNNEFISMGYNSFPRDCDDEKLPLTRPDKYKIIIHSEVNALESARRSVEGATAYITGHPCTYCFSQMVNKGIRKVIYGPIGSHCIEPGDIDLVKRVNISQTTGQPKIEMIKYETIADLKTIEYFCDSIKEYIDLKKDRNFING